MITISIVSSFNCISSFEKELKAIDKAILRTVQGLNPGEYTVLNSIPGIGKVYSAGILAEIGSVKAFKNADSLAKYCGIVWNDNDSGDFDSEDKRVSKAGNHYLRYYIIEATGSVIRHCPKCERLCQKKFAETRKLPTPFQIVVYFLPLRGLTAGSAKGVIHSTTISGCSPRQGSLLASGL